MALKVKTNETSLKVTLRKISEYASVVKNIHDISWIFLELPWDGSSFTADLHTSQNSHCKCPEFNLDSEIKEN